jgi:hypothetical protein
VAPAGTEWHRLDGRRKSSRWWKRTSCLTALLAHPSLSGCRGRALALPGGPTGSQSEEGAGHSLLHKPAGWAGGTWLGTVRRGRCALSRVSPAAGGLSAAATLESSLARVRRSAPESTLNTLLACARRWWCAVLEGGGAGGGDPEQLGAAVGGVGFTLQVAVGLQGVGQAGHGPRCDPEPGRYHVHARGAGVEEDRRSDACAFRASGTTGWPA